MKIFNDLHQKICSSPHYTQMLHSRALLNDHFGINHFWYYKLTSSGYYSYVGTHTAWSEYCFDNAMLQLFPCLRHPSTLQTGVNLMKSNRESEFKLILETAWKKFQINFNINLMTSIPNGIEAFGFGSRYNDMFADERLLNELPVLQQFTKYFRTKHIKLFDLLEDNQVDLSSEFGPKFYERPKSPAIPIDREKFLRNIGYDAILSLTSREKEILKYLASGYPASYIAEQQKLSKRTVENYFDNLKVKLSCESKIELIHKARDFVSILRF